MKRCVLIAAFGTSTLKGYETQFKPFVDKLEMETGLDIFIGFTSERIIKKLQDKRIISLEEKFKEIKSLNYEEVILVKLILSDGKENKKIDLLVEKNILKFKSIIKTNPILAYKSELIHEILDDTKDTVFISHGREDGLIDCISEEFKKEIALNYKKINFLSLNVKEESDSVINELLNNNITEVIFKPLLLTRGHHLAKDIYSEKEDSFKKRFMENKINVIEIQYGLLEDNNFIKFITEKIKKII